MNDNNQQKTFASEILERIKKGEVKMKTKQYFFLKSALLIIVFVVVFLITLFCVSLIAFSLKSNGLYALPQFGAHGSWLFFKSIPWLLILLVFGMAVILEILAKHFKFIYKHPLLYSLISLLVIVSILGTIIENTEIHERIFERMENQPLPVANLVYKRYGDNLPETVYIGLISSTTQSGFIIKPRCCEDYIILVNDETRLPLNKMFKTGDVIMVIGDKNEENVVTAEGIRPAVKPHRLHMTNP